jgi:putative peptidoglycan lipid II flippase
VANQKIMRSAGSISIFVLLSRIFGLFRDVSLASVFGTSAAMSAFIVAFTIPNLFRAFFGEGALTSAFIPVFTDLFKTKSKREAWSFAANVFCVLSAVLTAIVIVGIILVTLAIHLSADNQKLLLILRLLRIMLPYLFFICSAAFFAAVLNSLGYFALPASLPVILNMILIVTIWLCHGFEDQGYFRITALAWSVVIAGFIQWLMLLPLLFKQGFRFVRNFSISNPAFRKLLTLIPAVIIGSGITRINVLSDRFIALFSGAGGPSYLYFAERLVYLPLGIFAFAFGTVLLPVFSAHIAEGKIDELKANLNQSIRQLLFLTIPAAAGLIILGKPVISLLYQRGDFSLYSAEMTMQALVFYAPGVVIFSLLKILVPVFYAQKDMKTPVRIGAVCTGVNIVLSVLLLFPFKHAGIALATVTASLINVCWLSCVIHKRLGTMGWKQILNAALYMFISALVMSVVAVFAFKWMSTFIMSMQFCLFVGKTVPLFTAIILAVIIYVFTALLFRLAEPKEIWRAVIKK